MVTLILYHRRFKVSNINQPSHYQGTGMCANDVIRAFNLNFALGNVVKYVLRAGRKEGVDSQEDLRKALWYLQDELQPARRSDLEGLAAREVYSKDDFVRALNDDN